MLAHSTPRGGGVIPVPPGMRRVTSLAPPGTRSVIVHAKRGGQKKADRKEVGAPPASPHPLYSASSLAVAAGRNAPPPHRVAGMRGARTIRHPAGCPGRRARRRGREFEHCLPGFRVPPRRPRCALGGFTPGKWLMIPLDRERARVSSQRRPPRGAVDRFPGISNALRIPFEPLRESRPVPSIGAPIRHRTSISRHRFVDRAAFPPHHRPGRAARR